MDHISTITKSLKLQNEDILYADEKMAWVLDGATGIDGTHISDEASDAYWYVKELDAYLKKHLLDSDTMETILMDAIKQIKVKYKAFQGYHDAVDFPSCAGVITRFQNNELEYYVMADCELIIERVDGKIEEIVDHRVSVLDDIAIQAGIDASKKRNLPFCECKEDIKKVELVNRKKKNIEYFALSDDECVVKEGLTGSFKRDEVQAFCLISDGFAQYFEAMKLCANVEEFMMRCHDHTLEELYDELITLQKADDKLDRYPRFKISDDTSAVYRKLK